MYISALSVGSPGQYLDEKTVLSRSLSFVTRFIPLRCSMVILS
jgi:hypothetical protein